MKAATWNRVTAALCGLLLAAAGVAVAQDEDHPAAADARDQAREHFELGLQLMENENWEAALLEFSRSLDLHPTRSALFNAGMCQKALHRYLDALRTFQQWRDQYADIAPPEDLDAVNRAVSGLEAFIARIEVDVRPAGAEVLIDGETIGVSPFSEPVVVEIGRHVVEARLGGHEPARTEVAVASREVGRVWLELAASIGSDAPRFPVEPSEPPEPSSGIDQAWFWTIGATAVALGIGGGITGGLTLGAESDFDDAASRCRSGDPDACDEGYSIADDYEAYQLATNILLPAAGALAATAVILVFFTDFGGDDGERTDELPAVVAAPLPSPGGMSVGLAMSF